MQNKVLRGYAADAPALIPRYQNLSSSDLYSHVAHLFPRDSGSILDIGAGTGRDAAWFASQGHKVLAVEPVEAFREVGAKLHSSPNIVWLDDKLPDLKRALETKRSFDLLLMSGVWQHLDLEQRQQAMPNFKRLVAPKGRVVISVRHGVGTRSRPCFADNDEGTIGLAEASGLDLIFRDTRESIQRENRAAGVSWTWLVFSSIA